MAEFTREQLIEKLERRLAVTNHYPDVEEAQLDAQIFKIALAALTAAPEAYVVGSYSLLHYQNPKLDEYIKNATPLYRLPLLEGLK